MAMGPSTIRLPQRSSDRVSARAVVPTDFDNRRDVDLLVTSDQKVALWRNMRDGTFRDVAQEVGLGAKEITPVKCCRRRYQQGWLY